MGRIEEITPLELKTRLDSGDIPFILDVREPEEVAIAAFPRAANIPMGDIPARANELNPEHEIVVVCHHGVRSAHVAMHLAQMGFDRVINLAGGIDAWSVEADPAVPRY